METWLNIKGFEGKYQVSSTGLIKSLARFKKGRYGEDRLYKEIILKQSLRGKYYGVSLLYEGEIFLRHTHRLVAEAFHDNPLGLSDVNHEDGNKLNNNDWNLKWVTKSQNHIHRYQVLKQIGGNTGYLGKKSNIVRNVYKQYDLNGNLIAEHYGVCEASRAVGTHQSGKGIRRAIKRNGTYKGFRWTTEKRLT